MMRRIVREPEIVSGYTGDQQTARGVDAAN